MDRILVAAYAAAFALSFAAIGLALAIDTAQLACDIHAVEGVPANVLSKAGC